MKIYRDGFFHRTFEGPGVGGGAPAPAAWHAGLEAEFVGELQTRGLADKDPKEAALNFFKAHKEARAFVGAPADKLIRLPNDNDPAGWKEVWQKLGAPKDATGYEFKDSAGKALDPKLEAAMRETAVKLNLPKDTAAQLAADVAKMLETNKTVTLAEKQVAVDNARKELETNWGVNKEINMMAAKTAALNLGVTQEQVDALQSVVGYAKVMEMFRSIGVKIGEPNLVKPNGSGGGGSMTREQAVAELAARKADKQFSDRYMAGGFEEGKIMKALNQLING